MAIKIQAAGGRNRPGELTIDRADLPNPGIDRLSPDVSVLGDRQFWIELGKLGEKPLRKRRLERIGDHDVTEPVQRRGMSRLAARAVAYFGGH